MFGPGGMSDTRELVTLDSLALNQTVSYVYAILAMV